MPMLPNRPLPAEHWNYPDLDANCRCVLCEAYRQAVEKAVALKAAAAGHPFRCRCYVCQQAKAAHQNFLAITNQRDTYSELTYVVQHRPWRRAFLIWLRPRVLGLTGLTDGWWQVRAETHSLRRWIEDWIAEDAPTGSALAAAAMRTADQPPSPARPLGKGSHSRPSPARRT